MTLAIRTYGDPVLRTRAEEVAEVNGALVRLAEEMIATMHEAPGVGLAANQVGVLKRLFVYEEGCLSVPELHWPITRAKQVHLRGLDLEGNEVSIEADELLARVFQHELDHLDGVLLVERLDPDTRRQAMRVLRERALGFG
jgi:peptide deformylase